MKALPPYRRLRVCAAESGTRGAVVEQRPQGPLVHGGAPVGGNFKASSFKGN